VASVASQAPRIGAAPAAVDRARADLVPPFNATPRLDERQVLTAVLDHDPELLADRPGLLIIADQGYVSAELDRWLAQRGVRLLRPSYRNRTVRPGEHLLKPIRQLIESVNDTLQGQLDLELPGGRSIEGVAAATSGASRRWW
jgi:hypothetical protein